MRRAFAETLAEMASLDERIVLMTGDLGFMALEPFSIAHPDRFFNVGVAEQNMVGVATGLAEAGFLPYVYSIVNFATMRPFEFIRNGPVAHRLPVRIVSVGGGLEYGHNGLTHFGLEDLALLRPQSPLTLVVPADAMQARSAFRATSDLPGPIYYRLGKDDRIVVPGLDGKFSLGRAELLREGGDALIVTMGTAAPEVVIAAETLAGEGVECSVLLVSSFNPGPAGDLLAQLECFRTVFTVETHYTCGGLGSWVAELATEAAYGGRVVRCGVKATPDGVSGSQAFMLRRNGLDAASLASVALATLSAH